MNLFPRSTLSLTVASFLAGMLILGLLPAVGEVSKDLQPAVLLVGWQPGFVDLNYAKALSERGFEVGVVKSRADFNWKLASRYNVLVLFGVPCTKGLTPGGGPQSGPDLAGTLEIVERFLAEGGGVFLVLEQQTPLNEPLITAYKQTLEKFGAKMPFDVFEVKEPVTQTRLSTKMFYASGIHKTPVSLGLNGVWFPVAEALGGHLRPHSGPLELDSSWEVVLSAGPEVTAVPFDLSLVPKDTNTSSLYRSPGPVKDPVLFGIRSVGPGRLALLNMESAFHMGSGTTWLFDGVSLDKGLNGRPSDLSTLLDRTFRWLGEPSLGSGAVGGAKTDPKNFAGRFEGLEDKADFEVQDYVTTHLFKREISGPLAPVQKGFVGARSNHAGGKGTVEEYAAAARAADLQFLVFLDPFDQLSPEGLSALKEDCAKFSSPSLTLIPGYWMKTNVGPRFLCAGKDPIFPDKENIGGPDGKTGLVMPLDENGQNKSGDSWLLNVFKMLTGPRETETILGYFDFTRGKAQGGFSMPHARAAGAVGVTLTENGKWVEDLTEDYLLTNAGTMPFVPLAVNLVDSPAEMTSALEKGVPLTVASVPEPSKVLTGALRFNHQFESLPTSITSGPLIRRWPVTKRAAVFGGESFNAERCLLAAEIEVTSDLGLKDISIYDGDRLVWKVDGAGTKEFRDKIFRSAALQSTLGVVATDVQGGRAVSFPTRTWKDGSGAVVFCGDHVNDCRSGNSPMRMGRGPLWGSFISYPNVPNPGRTWDGGPGAFSPPFTPNNVAHPNPVTENGPVGGDLPTFMNQVPQVLFSDELVYRGIFRADGLILIPHANPWGAYAPILPNELFDATYTWTEFNQYSIGVMPNANGYEWYGGGNFSTMIEQELTFKKAATIKELRMLSGQFMAFGQSVYLARGEGKEILEIIDLEDIANPLSQGARVTVAKGQWLAFLSKDAAFNTMLLSNHGDPMRFSFSKNSQGSGEYVFETELPPERRKFAEGEKLVTNLLAFSWPKNEPIRNPEELEKALKYILSPTGLKITRGKRTDGWPLLIEVIADRFVAELLIPREPKDIVPVNLPVRISGLNPRWSAGLFQIRGENGLEYYGPGREVFRPLGLDPEGRAYFPLFASRYDMTHVVAGHPIVASGTNADQLFIQVIALKGPQEGQPGLWNVTVNNPTDQPITAEIRRNWEMPGLAFQVAKITLPPGGVKTFQHGEEIQ